MKTYFQYTKQKHAVVPCITIRSPTLASLHDRPNHSVTRMFILWDIHTLDSVYTYTHVTSNIHTIHER